MSICSIYNENLNNIPVVLQKQKYNYDRFIPNRKIMQANSSVQTYQAAIPTNAYELSVYQALFSGRHPYQNVLPLSSRNTYTTKLPSTHQEYNFEGFCTKALAKPCILKDNMLTVAVNNSIYAVDIKTLSHFKHEMEDNDEMHAFSWNTDQSTLAVAYNSNGLDLWDRNSGAIIALRDPTYEVRTSQVEWKNRNLIGMGYNLEFSLIDQRTARTALQHFNFQDFYTGFHFSKNEHHVYFTTSRGAIKTIDVRFDKPLFDKRVAADLITHFEMIDVDRAITASKDGCIRIFDIQSEKFKLIKRIDTKKAITSLALTEKSFGVSHEDGNIMYYERKNYSFAGKSFIPNLRFLFSDFDKQRLGVLRKSVPSKSGIKERKLRNLEGKPEAAQTTLHNSRILQ